MVGPEGILSDLDGSKAQRTSLVAFPLSRRSGLGVLASSVTYLLPEASTDSDRNFPDNFLGSHLTFQRPPPPTAELYNMDRNPQQNSQEISLAPTWSRDNFGC